MSMFDHSEQSPDGGSHSPVEESWVPAELSEDLVEWAEPGPDTGRPDAVAIAEQENSQLEKIRGFLAVGPRVAVDTLERWSDLSQVSRRIVREETVLPGILGLPERLIGRAIVETQRRTADGLGKVAATTGQAVGLVETVATSDSRIRLRALRVFDKFNSQGADLAPLVEKTAPLARRIHKPLRVVHDLVEKLADWITPDPDDTVLAR